MHAERINDWLWRLHTPAVAAYAVAERDGFNLVDTGLPGGAETILGLLAEIAGRDESPPVYEILLTHGHRDHTGSAADLADLTGALVLAPAAEAAAITAGHPPEPPELAAWEVPIFEKLGGEALEPAPPVRLDRELHGSEVLEWARPARILPAPGHTRGGIALLFEGEKVLLAGDAIASMEGAPIVGVFNVDRAQALETFRGLADLDIEVACFGHGEPLLSGAASRLSGSRSPRDMP